MEAALAYDKAILQNSSTFNQQRGSPNFPPEIYEKLVYFHEQRNAVFRQISEDFDLFSHARSARATNAFIVGARAF